MPDRRLSHRPVWMRLRAPSPVRRRSHPVETMRRLRSRAKLRVVSQIFLFSLTAALNPTLLTATTVMLVLPSPKRLLLGYLLGAYLTSITLGLVIVFTLGGSSTGTSSAKHTVNPILDIAVGLLILIIAFVVGTGRDERRRARRERKHAAQATKAPPRWKQALSAGSARTTFVVGALLTLPGASYLAGLDLVAKQNLSTAGPL